MAAMAHVVANEKATKEFKIPVSFEVYGYVKVQAETLEEAHEWALGHSDEIPLGDSSEWAYIDGSYEVEPDILVCESLNWQRRWGDCTFVTRYQTQ